MIKLEGFPEGTDELGIYEWTTDCEVKKKAMFKSDYTKLTLSFNEFHNVEAKDMPQHGEFCLLALKDGRHTAGAWYPDNDQDRETVSGDPALGRSRSHCTIASARQLIFVHEMR